MAAAGPLWHGDRMHIAIKTGFAFVFAFGKVVRRLVGDSATVHLPQFLRKRPSHTLGSMTVTAGPTRTHFDPQERPAACGGLVLKTTDLAVLATESAQRPVDAPVFDQDPVLIDLAGVRCAGTPRLCRPSAVAAPARHAARGRARWL